MWDYSNIPTVSPYPDLSGISNKISEYGPSILKEGAKAVAVEAAASLVDRATWGVGGSWIRSNYWSPSFVTAPFVRSVGRRLANSTRRAGYRAFRPARAPYVPQRRYPRQYVRQSHAIDRFRGGSRAIFWERPGDWKKQFKNFRV